MQTSYSLTPDALKKGEFTNAGGIKSVRSMIADEPVAVGSLVQRGSSDDSCKRLATSQSSKQVGIVVESNDRPIDLDTYAVDASTSLTDYFESGKEVNVCELTDGIAVLVDQDVTPDSSVYARICSTRAVQTITFDADFVASNSIAWSIDGVAQTAIVYATSHAATIAALAAAIEAKQQVYTCAAATRTLTITSENSNQSVFSFTVTGGVSQANDGAPVVITVGVAGAQGVFRADSDSGKAVLVSNAKFKDSVSSGQLVELKLV